MILPVTVPATLFDVYTYWLEGSSTMHTGPEPTGYGLLVSPIACSLPEEGSIVNAEIVLFAFCEFVVDWFTIYR